MTVNSMIFVEHIITVGEKDVRELREALRWDNSFYRFGYSPDPWPIKRPQQITLIEAKIEDLGFGGEEVSLLQILQKMGSLGVLCPGVLGLQLAVQKPVWLLKALEEHKRLLVLTMEMCEMRYADCVARYGMHSFELGENVWHNFTFLKGSRDSYALSHKFRVRGVGCGGWKLLFAKHQ